MTLTPKISLITMLILVSSQTLATSSCLDKERATRTWPNKELTRDEDGCWTYWRRGLKHELVGPSSLTGVDRTAAASTVPLVGAAATPNGDDQPLDTRWVERWPSNAEHLLEYRGKIQAKDDEPLVTPRRIALAIAIIGSLFAIAEVVFGPILVKKWKRPVKFR